MSDNFGNSVQPDVLAQENYNWDSVVLLKGRSVQTAEVALIGQLASAKTREVVRNVIPSGFLRMGSITQAKGTSSDLIASLQSAQAGDVLTSETLENSFYVASHGENWAVVDGMMVNLSATEEVTTHNLIKLTPTTSYSLVFMEVWRSLVAGVPDPTDSRVNVKAYGNQSSQVSLPNDLFIDAIGYETARRVQVQYRVRAVPLTVPSIQGNPDLLRGVLPQQAGGSVAPTDYAYASMSSSGDPSLYRAGKGDAGSRQVFASVDGYIYAIPMFLVFHRSGEYSPESLYGGNVKSDGAPIRPDGLYLDVVYPSDILDLRRVSAAYGNTSDILDKTFTGIASGGLSTSLAVTRGSGGGTAAAPGCTMLVKTDTLGVATSTVGKTTLGELPLGSSARRQFLAGYHEQLSNAARIVWSANQTNVSLDMSCFSGSNLQIYALAMYQEDGRDVSGDFTYSSANLESGKTLSITRKGSPTSEVTYLLYDAAWNRASSGDSGFTDVPEQFLQQRTVFANRSFHDNAVPGVPLFLKPRAPSATYAFRNTDRVECLGTEYKDISNFGQIAVLTRSVVTSHVYIYLENRGNRAYLPGTNQEVLGVRSVRTVGASTYLNVPSVSMRMGVSAIIQIYSDQLVNATEVEITLHLGTKFSAFTRSGRGVTETFETRWVEVPQPTDGITFKASVSDSNSIHSATVAGACMLLTGDIKKPLVRAYLMAYKEPNSGDDLVWEMLDADNLTDEAYTLPPRGDTPCNPTAIKWVGSAASVLGYKGIFVGLRLLSSYTTGEQLLVTYNTRGYQGVIPGEVDVDVLGEGPAYLTSLGSGSSQKLTYSFFGAKIKRESDSRSLLFGFDSGITLTHGEVLEGDYLSFSADPLLRYRVANVSGTPEIENGVAYTRIDLADAILPESFNTQNLSYTSGAFTRGDQLYWSDAISRLPTRENDGYRYCGLSISGDQALLKTLGVHVTPIAGAFSLTLGTRASEGVAPRGRMNALVNSLPGAPELQVAYPSAFGASNIAVPYKIYQTYLVREKLTGMVYMAVLASDYTSGSLAARTSPYNGYDAVDLFEVSGRVQFRGF